MVLLVCLNYCSFGSTFLNLNWFSDSFALLYFVFPDFVNSLLQHQCKIE